jgi:dipeptidase
MIDRPANPEERQECYMILAGKDATADGSILLAHDNDLAGHQASLIEKIPRMKHKAGEMITFPSGLEIPQVDETCEWMVLRIYSGFAEGDAVAINEYGVSIAGGVAQGSDHNKKAGEADPFIKKGLNGGVRYVALERSKTARECVETMGRLYTQYGVTYPSGVGVADGNEIWYIEAGGGHQWAAVRVPDDSYLAVANAYRIGEIDGSDTENYLASPNLLKFAREKGLWDPAQGPFNFAKAFGLGKVNDNPYYDSRRVWRGLQLLSPGVEFDPDLKVYPLFMKPDEKLTMEKLIDVLRDTYEGTPYSLYPEEGGSKERGIAVPHCIHTDVVQLRNWLPNDIGSVLWAGLGSPTTTAYVPFYFGINEIPRAYQTAGPTYDAGSAFWINRSLQHVVIPYYRHLIGEVLPVWQKFENEAMAYQPAFEKAALELYTADKPLGKSFLTAYSNGQALNVLETTKKLFEITNSRLAANTRKWVSGN